MRLHVLRVNNAQGPNRVQNIKKFHGKYFTCCTGALS